MVAECIKFKKILLLNKMVKLNSNNADISNK